MSIIDNISKYWRFANGLHGFLQESLSLEQSQQIIKRRIEKREDNFLKNMKKVVYENQKSPYLKLLQFAGCEYGDMKSLVRSEGLEATLHKLKAEGVYIDSEEFKCTKKVIRGGKIFKFEESDFDNPFLSPHLETSSGASRSAGTRTWYDFEFLTQTAAYHQLIFNAYGLAETTFAFWMPILPGAGPRIMLRHTKAGKTPVKWFSPVENKSIRPSLKKRLATNYIVYAGRAFGAQWPTPEHVTFKDAWKIAHWIAKTVRRQKECCFKTYVSCAVRICQAAKEKQLDISGTKMFIVGEPITPKKRKEIETVGVTAIPCYRCTEIDFIGEGCVNPATEDDVHLFKDCVAVIQHQRVVELAGISVNAFLFTSLFQSAPKIMLNVENGDYGVLESRHCGCKIGDFGFTDHIHTIRSFDKLTGEGMTLVGTDIVNIIEKVLPEKYGGASTDYQVVEEEGDSGFTRLSIVISPDVGTISEDEVVATFLSEVNKGKSGQRMMAEIMSQSGSVRVKRMQPIITARGKLLPLQVQKV